ncbi:MAG: hypothetical protein KR126chlam3_00481 [Chlamydiae bacterium]|nr:hypothetical protein [Chlamydiota bacterium]
MALDGVSSNQQTLNQTAGLQPMAPAKRGTTNFCATTLISEGEKSLSLTEKIKEHFWTAWEYVQIPFVKAWEWIVWVVHFCPAEQTPLEIMEKIVEDPKSAAKEFAKNPADNVGELVLAVLIDPANVKKLRDENEAAFGTFMKEFKRAYKKHADLLIGKEADIVPALLAFIDPTEHSGHDLFTALQKVAQQNPALVFEALGQVGKQVLEIVGEKKDEDNEHVSALRLIFTDYLPKVIEQVKACPDDFKSFFEELYALDGFNEDTIIQLFKNDDLPAPTDAELAALLTIFAVTGLGLRQLADPEKYFGSEYKGAKGMDIKMAFYQSILSVVEPDQIEDVIKTLKKDHPLLTAILQQAKDEDSATRKKIAENLPEALEVLAQLYADYQNPPKPAKK